MDCCNATESRDPVGLVQGTKTPKEGNTKKNTKKLQIPPPRVGPRKYGKKNPNTEMVIFVPFFIFSGVIFFVLSRPNPGWGICNFFNRGRAWQNRKQNRAGLHGYGCSCVFVRKSPLRQDLPPPLGRPKFRPWSEFSLPRNLVTILKLVWGGNMFYFQGLGISNRTTTGNSEFALRAFPECFKNA